MIKMTYCGFLGSSGGVQGRAPSVLIMKCHLEKLFYGVKKYIPNCRLREDRSDVLTGKFNSRVVDRAVPAESESHAL